MSRFNWQAFSAIASIFLALVALFGEPIRRLFLSPKLRVTEFDSEMFTDGEPYDTVDSHYLKVKNFRPLFEAKNCRVVLKKILINNRFDKKQNDNFLEIRFFTYPISSKQTLFDINKNPVTICFLTITDQHEIWPSVDFDYYPMDTFQSFIETCVYTLEIRGDYYRSQEQHFKVEYNKWATITELSKKEYTALIEELSNKNTIE
jgi:hypothetical protein